MKYPLPSSSCFNAQPLNPSNHVHQSFLYMCINYFSLGAIAVRAQAIDEFEPDLGNLLTPQNSFIDHVHMLD